MNTELLKIFNEAKISNNIPNEEYTKWSVKKGLRNEDGTGVLIGLTRIADVVGYQMVDGKKVDAQGELLYRGIKVTEIAKMIDKGEVNGYEEMSFLLLFGRLPNKNELELYKKDLRDNYALSTEYISRFILSNPSMQIMNKVERSLLMMYELDDNPDDSSPENFIKQGINVISKLPAMICYAYQAKRHLLDGSSLIIHHVDENKSIAENILSLLRDDQKYTEEEAKLLDLCLVLHLDHGAGNNSTFSSIVVSSTGTDIYSSLSAAVGSLKGPKHGGANIMARRMMKYIVEQIGVNASDEQIKEMIIKILNKEAFDNQGLIYGIGHAVYTLSDPRAEIIKQKAKPLMENHGYEDLFNFYERFENIAKEIIYEQKGKRVCTNIDFYSGLIYEMLQIPEDLYTPMFVMARTVGWIAHMIENKLYCSRIVRPAGKYVGETFDYIELEKR